MTSLTAPARCQSCDREAILLARRDKFVCMECFTADAPTMPEIISRQRKAYSLLEVLAVANVTADELRRAEEDTWTLAAQMAGVESPSLETRLIVIEALESRPMGRLANA